MNRRELVNAIAAQTELEPKQVDAALRGFTDVVTAVVSKGEPVAISGFAKFSKVERAARIPMPGFSRIDAVPMRALACLQQIVDGGAMRAAGGVRPVAEGFAEPAAFRVRLQVEQADDLVGLHVQKLSLRFRVSAKTSTSAAASRPTV